MASHAVSVVGVGRLGAPMAAVMAATGHRVVCVDSDMRRLEAVVHGRPWGHEPDLSDLLLTHHGQLTSAESVEAAVAQTTCTLVVVPTPSLPTGEFDTSAVRDVCIEIGMALRHRRDYHLVVVVSTLAPGTTQAALLPALQQQSRKMCPGGFGLCYVPQFIALGSVIQDLRSPYFVLIGESDPDAGELTAGLFRSIADEHTQVFRMSFINAELAKVAINTFVTLKIGYVNMLARLCERVVGANADTISAAMAADPRIGRGCLTGAVSYGGPCFPRDNRALERFAALNGLSLLLPEAADGVNSRQGRLIADLVEKNLEPDETVGLLGLSYKHDSDVVDGSAGIALANLIAADGYCVHVHDPVSGDAARRLLRPSISVHGSVEECLARSDRVIVAVPWRHYRVLPAHFWARAGRARVVIDCWRALSHLRDVAGVDYMPLGHGPLLVDGRASRT